MRKRSRKNKENEPQTWLFLANNQWWVVAQLVEQLQRSKKRECKFKSSPTPDTHCSTLSKNDAPNDQQFKKLIFLKYVTKNEMM